MGERKRLIVRIYHRTEGIHVHARIFANLVPWDWKPLAASQPGGRTYTLGLAGEVCFRVEEWAEVLYSLEGLSDGPRIAKTLSVEFIAEDPPLPGKESPCDRVGEGEEEVPPSCPMCGGEEQVPLGDLGRLRWWRCRACGWDHGSDATPARGEGREGKEL